MEVAWFDMKTEPIGSTEDGRVSLASLEAPATLTGGTDFAAALTWAAARCDAARGSGPLDPETRRFIENAHIEGEIRDAGTDQLLAAGVDRRRREGAPPIDTWAEVDRAIDFWAARLCTRLEARTGERRAPGAP